ncbi:hypothetical protein TL16_g08099 [Triparma laevis f. inornata]|uniref:PWI domain-containing protein n=1 Tax=Triparma laevis f. inornata TaxID=1714386 RepID=A0A9W7AWM2_9STRA|nr:hypothetical protein TL16_g08099 [Triparma laevis f. inornata]
MLFSSCSYSLQDLNEEQCKFDKLEVDDNKTLKVDDDIQQVFNNYVEPKLIGKEKIKIQIDKPQNLTTENEWDEVENDDTDVLTSPDVLEKVLGYRYKLRDVWEIGRKRRKGVIGEEVRKGMDEEIGRRRKIEEITLKRGREEEEEERKKQKLSEVNQAAGERKKRIDVPKGQEEIKKINRVPRLKEPKKEDLEGIKGGKSTLSEIYQETYAVIKKSTALRNHVSTTVENYLGAKEKSVIDMIMTEFTKKGVEEVWEGIWGEMEGVLEEDTGKFLEEIWKGVRWFCNGDE